jgi:hypothetical protein
VAALLRDPSCGFVLVAGPNLQQAKSAESFWARLEAESIHLVGLVLNRVHVWPDGGPPPDDEPEAAERGIAWLSSELAASAPELDAPAARGRSSTPRARKRAGPARRLGAERLLRALPLEAESVRVVPLFSEDVHELAALASMAEQIFGERARG